MDKIGSAAAPALQVNPDGFSGSSSQRGFRAGGQDLVCRPGCPSHHRLNSPAPGSGGDWPQAPRPVPTDADLHPSPWGYLDWGRRRSPFHRLLLAVGITAPKGFQGCAIRPKPYLTLRHQTALITLLLLQPPVFAHRLPPPPTNMPSLLHSSPQIL